jgi:hypothetical protein
VPSHPHKLEAEDRETSRSFGHFDDDALVQDAFEDVIESGVTDDPFKGHPMLRSFGSGVLAADARLLGGSPINTESPSPERP